MWPSLLSSLLLVSFFVSYEFGGKAAPGVVTEFPHVVCSLELFEIYFSVMPLMSFYSLAPLRLLKLPLWLSLWSLV